MVTINIYTAGGTQQGSNGGSAAQTASPPAPDININSSGGITTQSQSSTAPQPTEQSDMQSSASAQAAPTPQMNPEADQSGQNMEAPSPTGNMASAMQTTAEDPSPTLQPQDKASEGEGGTPQPDTASMGTNNVTAGGDLPDPSSQPPGEESGSTKGRKR